MGNRKKNKMRIKINNLHIHMGQAQKENPIGAVIMASMKDHLQTQNKEKPTATHRKPVSKEGPITDRIKSFEDACDHVRPSEELYKLATYKGNDPDIISLSEEAKLIIINRALNEDWEPNWSDSNERKWVPIFTEKPGFGLSLLYVAHWFSSATVGSRLCLKNEPLARYSATQFPEIWKNYLTIKK